MNLKELRAAMFAQSDWAPTQSPEAITRANGFINRAYKQLLLEAPFLFFESEVHLATEADVIPLGGDASNNVFDTIRLLGTNTLPTTSPQPTGQVDPWTWTVTYSATQAATGNFNVWKYDRSWDGRMIEITATDGTVYRNQIRSIWFNASSNRYEFTLVRPWDWQALGVGTDAAGFKYRIYTDSYAMPDDVVELKSTRIYHKTLYYPLTVIGQQEAEERCLMGPRSQIASGIPRVIFRRAHEHLPGPTTAPDVALNKERTATTIAGGGDSITISKSLTYQWKGPEPPGEFEYCITYTWGKRDIEFRNQGLAHWRGYAQNYSNENQAFERVPGAATDFDAALNRYREPWLESAPSPISAKISTVAMDGLNTGSLFPAITLTLPNIEYALGFLNQINNPSGSAYSRKSLHQSGIHVRIYRRRLSMIFPEGSGAPTGPPTDYFASGLNKLDISSAFNLLAEMRIDEVNEGIYIDNGEVIPDHSRRLRDTHGYQTFGCYPRPSQRYVFDLRCLRRPRDLLDDSDVPLVHSEATNVLVQRAMTLLYENMGQLDMAQYCANLYKEELYTLSKRYGDLRPPATPVKRRLSRAGPSYRRHSNFRKWWDTSTTS